MRNFKKMPMLKPALLGLLALCISTQAQISLRKSLLDEARLRINVWHMNQSLLEKPTVKHVPALGDVSLNMLKHDLMCGGEHVPVGYAEFDVPGVRPIDIFNTVMDVAAQMQWNPKANAMKHVGDWPEEGARGWDNVFNLIFNKKIEFLIWQVADIDHEKEEYWMVTSTKGNGELRARSPKQKNWIESDNCLGAYRITKTPTGAHVVITQHVNAAVGLWFPFHMVLKVFPIAWKGMIDFVTSVGEQSVRQSQKGFDPMYTVAPLWMVPQPKKGYKGSFRNMTVGTVMRFDENPLAQTATQRQLLRILATGAFIICLGCACMALSGAYFLCNRPAHAASRQNSDCSSQCSEHDSMIDSECDEYMD